MKIIDQSHQVIDRDKLSPAQLIELCGRTCYKSEDKITDDSAVKFVEMVTKRRHLSVLEHGALALEMPHDNFSDIRRMNHEYIKFLNFSKTDLYGNSGEYRYIVSGNLRAWLEFLAKTDFGYDAVSRISYLVRRYCEVAHEAFFKGCGIPSSIWERRYTDIKPIRTTVMSSEEYFIHGHKTVRFITNRSVTHELVRHRPASYSQESTRYVNYGGDDIQFIKPVWMEGYDINKLMLPIIDEDTTPERMFLSSCKNAELFYKGLLRGGWRPEHAREVLPNSLKTEIIVTASLKEWQHIFKLRCSKAAHPQIRALMLACEQDVL